MEEGPLVAVVGPTASGKTALAVRLALAFGGELVSADSRQVYRGMDIGTGKERDPLPGPDGVPTVLGVPQHLIDIVEPDASFTVADWQERAFAAVAGIRERGRLPIVVGGTGLYVRAVVDALEIPRVPPDAALRRRLEKKTAAELLWELRDLDPERATTIDRRNKRRLVRAIEVARATPAGEGKAWPRFRTLQLGIDLPRQELYRRIDARVDEQVSRGLFAEVRGLLERYGTRLPALSGIGYREVIAHLEGTLTEAEAVQRIKWDSHAYARRQLTWFRKDRRVRWLADPDAALPLVREFLTS